MFDMSLEELRYLEDDRENYVRRSFKINLGV